MGFTEKLTKKAQKHQDKRDRQTDRANERATGSANIERERGGAQHHYFECPKHHVFRSDQPKLVKWHEDNCL